MKSVVYGLPGPILTSQPTLVKCKLTLYAYSIPHNTVCAYHPHRFTIDATHTDTNEHYIYKVGVCVNAVDNDKYSSCGVVQSNATNINDAHCAGDVNTAQVSRSKSPRYLLWWEWTKC